MKTYKIINNVTGWIVFAIATVVYILTIEPTASFWDCGEFISSAFKLEVGHPPGAPFFMLMGNIATLFAAGNTELVAKAVNSMSALASSFTILFLFWTITHLARKIVGNKDKYSAGELIAIIGSGVVGALAYTFSDTFWFSAVEGEVYASSSLFTALVFWAILKWEDAADEKYANRWLVLIAYLMGLSIGVHLLNLLAIPPIVLIYYFRKYPVTRKGIILTVLLSFAILGFVMYGMIQGTIAVASWFELMFVNWFGFPYRSGMLFFVAFAVVALVFGLRYTWKKGKTLAHTIVLCATVILLGYSSYAVIVIRSQADLPMDQNDPETMFNLLSYLNREQYGDRPLIYGPVYNSYPSGSEEGKPIFSAINDKYVKVGTRPKYTYESEANMLFPRMFSHERNHQSQYKSWVGRGNSRIIVGENTDNQGQKIPEYKPTFWQNIEFFLSYQINYMYFRYFMWNFAGRQNDIQGVDNGLLKGQWLSGINFIDELRLGPQDKLPKSLSNNKAYNRYYMLPFLLGLFGLFFQLNRHKRDFWTVMLLFFMTGIAIVIYLNQTPLQPRERDYAYAGSFYAYAIWIGLGVMGIINVLAKKMNIFAGILVTLATLALVPGIMASENWDDHDRSNRKTARDFAYNYLNSCEKDAIIFTNGDNDTFPLWYAQEVEGIRTDVRVINLSYLSADWYIEQMQRKAYESEVIPFSLTRDKYIAGKRDQVIIREWDNLKNTHTDLKEAIEFIASDAPETKLVYQGDTIPYLPNSKLSIKVDSSVVLRNNVVNPRFAHLIVPEMKLNIKGSILKNDLMVLDLLAHNNWQRPVYFAITVGNDNYTGGINKYFRLDGLAYRIVPIETQSRSDAMDGSIDTDILYENYINKFKWGNIDNPNVYLDENNMRMLMNFRNNFARLAEALIAENKMDSAVKVLNKCLEVMPPKNIPINYYAFSLIEQFYKAGLAEKANGLMESLYNTTLEDLNYYLRFKGNKAKSIEREKITCIQVLGNLVHIAQENGQTELMDKIYSSYKAYEGFFR